MSLLLLMLFLVKLNAEFLGTICFKQKYLLHLEFIQKFYLDMLCLTQLY